MVAAALQRPVGDVELDPAVFLGRDQVPGQLAQVAAGGLGGGPEVLEHPPPTLVVHRPAVVRVDQAEVPELGPLVGVRHAGRGELEQRLRQRVEEPVVADPPLEGPEVVEERAHWSASSRMRPTNSWMASSYSALGLIQLVCTLASWRAFSM